MELLLNTFWLVIAAGALGIWIRQCRRSAKRQDLHLPLFALGCVLVLFLPVISATDDLHATPLAVEASGLSRKIPKCITPSGASARTRWNMIALLCKMWLEDDGQDIAEYAVMLALILVLVVGTIRLVGSNANNAFSAAASSIQ